jgi:hypothetical protein
MSFRCGLVFSPKGCIKLNIAAIIAMNSIESILVELEREAAHIVRNHIDQASDSLRSRPTSKPRVPYFSRATLPIHSIESSRIRTNHE